MNCFEKIKDGILDLIYPKNCVMCGKYIKSFGNTALCFKCAEKKITPKIIKSDENLFSEAVAVLPYDANIRKAMINYKFRSQKYYSYTFAKIIFDAIGSDFISKDYILCCVPMTTSRNRPYNQTKEILKHFAKFSGMTPTYDLFYKSRDIKPVSKMNRTERALAVKGTVRINPFKDVYDKNILVFDDIFTTGATANECAKVLKAAGAADVKIICACGE